MGFGHCTKMSVHSTLDRYRSESSPIHQVTVTSVWRWARRAVEADWLFFPWQNGLILPQMGVWYMSVVFSSLLRPFVSVFVLSLGILYHNVVLPCGKSKKKQQQQKKPLNSFFIQDAIDMLDNITYTASNKLLALSVLFLLRQNYHHEKPLKSYLTL